MEHLNYILSKVKKQLLQMIEKNDDLDKKKFFKILLNSVSEHHHSSPKEIYNDLEKIYEMYLKNFLTGINFIMNYQNSIISKNRKKSE